MIKFWNGNKSPARQSYEHELLSLLLDLNGNKVKISNDKTDYPNAEDEGAVFEHGTDVLVTVAGNAKFEGKRFHEVKVPLCKGLLGWRVLIVANERLDEFKCLSLNELKQKRVGVPDTWVDAELFRANGFDVLEKGNLDEMLGWVKDGTVDFITLGANEAKDILDSAPELAKGLSIEPSITLYYPFPLVFYVNENRSDLASLLKTSLLENSSAIDELFQQHYGHVIDEIGRSSRMRLTLENPLLPCGYQELLEQYL